MFIFEICFILYIGTIFSNICHHLLGEVITLCTLSSLRQNIFMRQNAKDDVTMSITPL